jgi:hypothetical protein
MTDLDRLIRVAVRAACVSARAQARPAHAARLGPVRLAQQHPELPACAQERAS